MKITEDLIKDKCLAGYTAHGHPIVFVETYGGLLACFAKNQRGQMEALATAPHRFILTWMAEKKAPGIKWEPEFMAKRQEDGDNLFKSARETMFTAAPDDSSAYQYSAYDHEAGTITQYEKKEDLIKSIREGHVSKYAIVRGAGGKPSVAVMHPEFGAYYGR